jgi:TP901 family phage tail tape measure protein
MADFKTSVKLAFDGVDFQTGITKAQQAIRSFEQSTKDAGLALNNSLQLKGVSQVIQELAKAKEAFSKVKDERVDSKDSIGKMLSDKKAEIIVIQEAISTAKERLNSIKQIRKDINEGQTSKIPISLDLQKENDELKDYAKLLKAELSKAVSQYKTARYEGTATLSILKEKSQELRSTTKQLNTELSLILAKNNLLQDVFKIKSTADIKSEISGVASALNTLKSSGIASFGEITRASIASQKQINELKKELTGVDFSSLGNKAKVIGGVATSAVVVKSVKESASREDSLIEIQKVGRNLSKLDLSVIDKQITSLTRKLPLTYQELAEVGVAASNAGLPVREFGGFMELVGKASSAFGVSAGETADAFGLIRNTYKLNNEELKNVGNAINYTADNLTNVTEKGIITSLSYTLSSAKLIGLTAKELVGLNALVISKTGGNVERASAAIRRIFDTLSTAPSQAKPFQEALKAMGLSAEELQKSINKDAKSGIINFLERIKEFDKEGRQNLLGKLLGTGQDNATVKSLLDDIPAIRKVWQQVNDEKLLSGNLDRASALENEKNNAKVKILKNNFNELATVIGDKLKPAFDAIVSVLATVTKATTDFLNKNPKFADIAISILAVSTALYAVKKAVGITLFALEAIAVIKTLGTVTAMTNVAGSVGIIRLALLALAATPAWAVLLAGAVITTTFLVVTKYYEENPSAKPTSFDGGGKAINQSKNFNPVQVKDNSYYRNGGTNSGKDLDTSSRQFSFQNLRDSEHATTEEIANLTAKKNAIDNLKNSENAYRATQKYIKPVDEKKFDVNVAGSKGKKSDAEKASGKDKKIKDTTEKDNKNFDKNTNKELKDNLQNNFDKIKYDSYSAFADIERRAEEASYKISASNKVLDKALKDGIINLTTYSKIKSKFLDDEYKLDNDKAILQLKQIDDELKIVKQSAIDAAQATTENKTEEGRKKAVEELAKLNQQIKELYNKKFDIELQVKTRLLKNNDLKQEVKEQVADLQKELDANKLELKLKTIDAKIKSDVSTRKLTDGQSSNNSLFTSGFLGNSENDKAIKKIELQGEQEKISVYDEQIKRLEKIVEVKKAKIIDVNGNNDTSASLIANNDEINNAIALMQEYKDKIADTQTKLLEFQNSESVLKKLGDVASNSFNSFFDNITSGTVTAKQAFKSLAVTALQAIRDIVKEALKASAIKLITSAIASFNFGVNNNDIASFTTDGKLAAIGGAKGGYFNQGLQGLKGYALGGGVALSTALAGIGGYAHAGEYTFNPAQVQAIGIHNLELMNKGINPYLNGYTGDGEKYDFAGLIQKGSFVINKDATQKLDLKNFDGMGKLADYMVKQDKLKGYADGGSVTNNTTSNTQPQAQTVQIVQPVINIVNNTSSKVDVDNSRWIEDKMVTFFISDIDQGGPIAQRLQKG